MLEDGQIFVSVVDNHGFSKAARNLNLATSVVTRRIAHLEKELGARLLQRNTRQVTLTEAGAIFYETCLDMLQTYKLAQKQVKNLNSDLIGTLKIGLPSSISHLHVTTALSAFLKKYPDLQVQIVNGNHLLDLLSNGFDLIVHCGELADSNYYCRKLGTWTKIVCAAPAYLKRYGTPKSPEQLQQHNCLDHYDNITNKWKFIEKGETKIIPIQGNIRVNSSLDLKNLAVAGLGVAYLPSFTVKHELKSGKLKPLLTAYQPPPLGMYVVYPSNKFLTKKIQLFIDFLAGAGLVD